MVKEPDAAVAGPWWAGEELVPRLNESQWIDVRRVYEAWYNRAPFCPQLYLYSDADPLIPASEVERYMKIQASARSLESRGVEVSSYKWTDSGHCEHFRKISQFMSKVLKDW
eukprot:gene23313-30553_t